MPALTRIFVAAFVFTLGLSSARAAEPLVPQSQPNPPPTRPAVPESGFTFGMHLGFGYPFLKATPQEQHVVAAALGARLGYRFAPSIAVYVDGTGFFTVGGSDSSIAFAPDGTPYGGEALTAAGIASLALAVRPLRWLELSGAPALAVHSGAQSGRVAGGAVGHLAFPIPVGRATLSPTVALTGLTSNLWSQIALTGGLGVDW